MSAELLPCPFCGGSAEFASIDDADSDDFGGEYVQCTNHACAASSMLIFPTMADAKPLLIEKWNRRQPDSSERVALTADQLYANDELMALNATHGMPMSEIMKIARVIEAAHNIPAPRPDEATGQINEPASGIAAPTNGDKTP